MSIPSIQAKLGHYATKKINEEFNTDISINKVGLKLNGDVNLKEILIKDHKNDTLINIEELNTSIISFKNIYNNKLHFSDITILNLIFNLKTYKNDSNTNFDIFIKRFEENKTRLEPSTFLFSSSNVSVKNGQFSIKNENLKQPKVLEFSNLNLNTTNFLITGPDLSASINQLSFKDYRGINIKNLTTNFSYTLQKMTFEELNILTDKSSLQGYLTLSYKPEDLKHFSDKVNVNAKFTNSEITLTELNAFFDEFGTDQRAMLNTELYGTPNNLHARNLNVTTSRNTRIVGNLNFKNLFSKNTDDFSLDGTFKNLDSNYKDLVALLPNILGNSIPSIFNNLGNFKLSGTSFVKANQINAKFDMDTDLGFAKTNLDIINFDNIDNASYKGKLVLKNFDIGTLVNDSLIKQTSLNVNVNGKGFRADNIKSIIKGDIYSLNYNNYTYKNIAAFGNFGKKIFNGILKTKDPNLFLDFNGLVDFSKNVKQFNFKADIGFANLNSLNFVVRDTISEFKGIVTMRGSASSFNDAEGIIKVRKTTYKNQDDYYKFKDFDITSSFDRNNIHTLTINSPDIVKGKITGQYNVTDIFKLIENSLGSIYTNYQPIKIDKGQYLNFNFDIYSKIATIFNKDLILSNNTFIEGKIKTDEQGFQFKLNAPEIRFKKFLAYNIKFNIDNSNLLNNTYVKIDSLDTGFYKTSDFSLINTTKKDTLFIKSEFKGGINKDDYFNLNLFYTINQTQKHVAGFSKSFFTFKNADWVVNTKNDTHNKIEFDSDLNYFNILPIVINNGNEEVKFHGVIKDTLNKSLALDFKNVQLEKVTPKIDSLQLKGIVNGKINFEQNQGIYYPKSNLIVSNLIVNKYKLGTLSTNIIGNSLTDYKVSASLGNNTMKSFKTYGFLNVEKNNASINLDVSFNDFLLDPLNPLGEGVISNIRGQVSGNGKVIGKLNKPDIEGELFLDKAGLSIPYLNVDYGFGIDSRVALKKQQFILNNITLTDTKFFTKAKLNGFISHTNFSDWSLGLKLNTDRLLVLNTKETNNSLYYGNGYITGSATISGPADQLVIDVIGSTAKGTVFQIPLNESKSFGDNSYIHFLSPEEKTMRLKGDTTQNIEVKGVELNFDLDVNRNTTIEIVLDKESGSTIKGNGEGNLVFIINTKGKFNMWGDFVVFQGIYNFKYKGLVEKRFEVDPGGNIVWNGNPLNAELNLKAVYKTNANPSVLLDNPIVQSIPVEVEIQLTGPLEQPQPNFNFRFPNVTSTVKSELEYRLSAKDERDNQALILLATGGFTNSLGGINISGTIAERLSGIINNIIGGENENLNLGVDLEIGQDTPELQTNNRVGFTLQTKINDRLIINGKLGVPFGNTQQTTITGDVQIDWLLNDMGTLRAKVFNRENPIRNFVEEIGFTQGLGLSYNVEFDTFKELIQKILFKKEKTKENTTTKKI